MHWMQRTTLNVNLFGLGYHDLDVACCVLDYSLMPLVCTFLLLVHTSLLGVLAMGVHSGSHICILWARIVTMLAQIITSQVFGQILVGDVMLSAVCI